MAWLECVWVICVGVGGASLTSRLSFLIPRIASKHSSRLLGSLSRHHHWLTGVVSVVVLVACSLLACGLPLCAWCCLYGGGAFYFIV